MYFQEFRREMYPLGCFTTNQAYAWRDGFDKNNLSRWVSQGHLIRLRNGYYTFPEYLGDRDFAFYLANRIYRPSYISLHTALAFYSLIPESIVHITSITTLKTATFTNSFGTYTYNSVKPELMFGYEPRLPAPGSRLPVPGSLLLATPAKAIADLLYINPFYDTQAEMEELRIDLSSRLLKARDLEAISYRIANPALDKRIRLFIKTYAL
ncbi:MAG: hypothetical protein NTY96_06810 [Bacteroidetes bacterium]|nr:hypothetical protein [Bacteroidota bacterium]